MSVVDQPTTAPLPPAPVPPRAVAPRRRVSVPVPRGVARVGLHLALAAAPLLAISAHVLGLVSMHVSAAVLILPLAVALVTACFFFPHGADRVLLLGWLWGMAACTIYDAFRLDTVYMLGWWGDFIPTMGTWITGNPDRTGGAVAGYLWRYLGDAGGIGVAFFVFASVLGLHRRSLRTAVAASVAFAVVPVWSGLILTVALSSGGHYRMFPLTPVTVTLSLIGHLIFGTVLGLGFWRTRAAHQAWPWVLRRRSPARLVDLAPDVRAGDDEPVVVLPHPRAPVDPGR